ncbi:hypothetical protein [Flavobacterium ardleyense]|uniref:hypothetical protein n=1 Tax=Flavobacterium ardleyense TaxID=2038737 RepID=UPI00298C1EFB|nr:hypothetical protein [Flavobacterium ardleyense]
MDILFSTAFFLLVVFLITQFLDSKNSKTLIILASFAILVGIISIIYVSYFTTSTKIINPVEITVQNSTNQSLKIYAITFDADLTDTINTTVLLEKELAVAKKTTFLIDNKNLQKFWIVAKNEANEIKFLKSSNKFLPNLIFKITTDENIDKAEAQTARELIFDRDIKMQVLRFAIWSNILLIALLLWSIFKLNKIRNKNKSTLSI